MVSGIPFFCGLHLRDVIILEDAPSSPPRPPTPPHTPHTPRPPLSFVTEKNTEKLMQR